MSAEHTASQNEMRARAALRSLPLAADGLRVGRTHRVVRERALAMQETRRQRRGLWLPLTIVSTMLAMICYAAWTGFAQYDLTGISDEFSAILRNGSQMMIYSLWFLPLSAAALVFAWRYWNRNGESRR